ncbi:hypothetical protein F5878DRAFT_274168 [Lentinula raphanica]|uniref:Uncharacterized protein n=1 Tax=Lentinula raphanica TaxID=153919 RepID=A0AA38UB56_9AGAR|nr:hypothetical protein F5878DRAFT_274168 [Lentinula raphanica]
MTCTGQNLSYETKHAVEILRHRALSSDPSFISVFDSHPIFSASAASLPQVESNTHKICGSNLRKKPSTSPVFPNSPTMYLFRLVFTRHSLVVNIMFLSLITAVIALPPGRPRKEQPRIGESTFRVNLPSNTVATSSGPPRKKSKTTKPKTNPSSATTKSNSSSDKIKYIIALIIEGEEGKAVDPSDPLTIWTVVFLTVEDQGLIGNEARGYRTIRDPESPVFKWKRQVDEFQPSNVNGARVVMSKERLVLKIGTVTMSPITKSAVTQDMGAEVQKNRLDKLPNVPSIYQFLNLLHDQLTGLKYSLTVTDHEFDISESSEFGNAFKQMVSKKGTGAGEVLSEDPEKDQWERELYKRIESRDIILEESLKKQNSDIFEKLWNEIQLPDWAFKGQDAWDKKWWDDNPTSEGSRSPDQVPGHN